MLEIGIDPPENGIQAHRQYADDIADIGLGLTPSY
jgi:hypothetical protein